MLAPTCHCATSSGRSSTLVRLRAPSRSKKDQAIRLRSASSVSLSTGSHLHHPRESFDHLPLEIVYEIFDILDPIDCACLGLASKRLYAVLRHMYGTVPLSCRRNGPNELEWAWHENIQNTIKIKRSAPQSIPRPSVGSGLNLSLRPSSCTKSQASLGTYQEDGQGGFCRHCGVKRCELHRHLSDWMSVDDHNSEYCSVVDKFVSPSRRTYVKAKDCFTKRSTWPPLCGKHAPIMVARQAEAL